MDPDKIKAALEAIESGDAAAALEILKGLVASAASGGETPAAETPETPVTEEPEALAEAPAEEPEEDPTALAVLSSVRTILGTKSDKETLSTIRTLSASAKLAAEEARAAETAERATLVGELVTLGVELPATAWADPDTLTPVKRLADESLASLRGRLELLRAAPRGSAGPSPAPTSKHTLSAADQERAKGMTPAQLERFEARRARRGAK